MIKSIAWFAAATLAATLPVTAAPLRHLEYGFSTYPTVKVGQSSIGTIDGPGTGTMSVDFVGQAPDGGTLVDVQEWYWYHIRPEQTRTCEVYSSGALTCDQYPTPTLAENVLMPMLASEFVKGDASSPWQAAYTMTYPDNFYSWSVAMNADVVRTTDAGRVLDIEQNGILRQIGGSSAQRLATASIAYDRTAGVPVTVHEERSWAPMRGIVGGNTSIDLKLLHDSAAR